jgi:hypothetical protein
MQFQQREGRVPSLDCAEAAAPWDPVADAAAGLRLPKTLNPGLAAGTMVGLLAVARSVTALGREHFLPPVSAWVHHKTQTPIVTTAVLGIVTGDAPRLMPQSPAVPQLIYSSLPQLVPTCTAGLSAQSWPCCLLPYCQQAAG